MRGADLSSKHCVPCEGYEKPFGRNQAEGYLRRVKDWELGDNGILKIHKKFKFKNFKEALSFVNKVGEMSESEGHHPDINFGWGKAEIILWTHAVGGLSENDFILAAKINKLQLKHERSEAK